jgi:hypothetical protein
MFIPTHRRKQMADFFLTRMGQKFYMADVPRIAAALEG